MVEFRQKQLIERKKLLKICKEHGGEHLPPHHGSGSWATTYSNVFIKAAADLWLLYEKVGCQWPHVEMSKDFRMMGIRSCRGADMSFDRVEYLFKTHISKELQRRNDGF